jgi:type II secretory pathway pseudopilin PulG
MICEGSGIAVVVVFAVGGQGVPSSVVGLVPIGQTRSRRRGATFPEVLVVLSVIGMLVSLLGPAVQAARERARQTQCRNNLRQIGIAVQNHESQFGQIVSCGWNMRWIGEPSRGFGPNQPGGWVYNLLPLIDRADLLTLGISSDPAERLQQQQTLLRTSIPLLRCPTRGTAVLSPPGQEERHRLINSVWPSEVAKADYAVSAGSRFFQRPRPMPTSLDEIDGFVFEDQVEANGVSFQRSRVRTGQITDGLSSTILAGEKWVHVESYSSMGEGYDASMYNGAGWDQYRWTESTPWFDGYTPALGLNWSIGGPQRFGSAHRDGVFHVMCDGSVRLISFFIDGDTYWHLGNRHDGEVVSLD